MTRGALVLVGCAVIALMLAPPTKAQNLLVNSSFSSDLSGWQQSSAPGVVTSWSAADANGSPTSGSVRAVAQPSSTGGYGALLRQCVAVTPGATYTSSAHVRTIVTGQPFYNPIPGEIEIQFPDGSTVPGGYTTSAATWTSISAFVQMPAGVTQVCVAPLYFRDKVATVEEDFDDIQLVGPLPPTVGSFAASPSTIAAGQTSTLSWSTTYATTVMIDNGVGAQPLSGSVAVTPSATTIYTLRATGPGGTATRQVTVTVTLVPTITFTATPASIATGQSSSLSWSTTNATTVTIDNGIGPQPVTGSVNVAPITTTAYTLTATGNGGTATKQVTVTVQPPPAVTFSASPTTIAPGQSSTLSWTTTNATSVTVDHGIGAQALTGSLPVSPAATTTYMLTATGAGGTRTAAVTVTVTAPGIPQIAFTASPSVIAAGETATLAWTTANATSITIDSGIGAKPLNGSVQVTPAATTTYTLTATGAGGTNTATATVTIAPAPTLFFTATPTAVLPSGAVKLDWQVFDAVTVALDPGLGLQPLAGSMTVTPAKSTTYLLTATGAGGTRVAHVIVTIVGKRRAVRH